MHDSFVAALALAALASDDATATGAALAPALRVRVDAVLAERARHTDRTAALRTLLAATAPPLPSASSAIGVRARSLLATIAPREMGAAWLRAAPPPRAGFRVSAAIRATIRATPEDAWRA